MGLSEKQIRFAYSVAAGKTVVESYIYAYDANKTSAEKNAHRLMDNDGVVAAIAERREALAAVEGIDRNWVLHQWKQLAIGDPNDLMQIRRVNCRHCWGVGHEYQWGEREYRMALDASLDAKEPKPAPDCLGGFGWVKNAAPNLECPECSGEGYADVHVSDTRKLSGPSRKLYSGVKVTKDGIEVKTRDADAALKNIAGYLGMTLERKEISGPGGAAIPLEVKSAKELTEAQIDKLLAQDTVDNTVNRE